MARLRSLLLATAAAAALLALSACRVETSVDVTVNEDGSGVVIVSVAADDDAVAYMPDLASGELRLDDISEAGWVVSGAVVRADGGVTVTAAKEFESAGQIQLILDELAGPGVIFSDVSLSQSREFARAQWDFSASIDPSPPLEAFSDARLGAVLDGEIFGRPLGDLLAEISALEDSFALEFALTLPADIEIPDDAESAADADAESAGGAEPVADAASEDAAPADAESASASEDAADDGAEGAAAAVEPGPDPSQPPAAAVADLTGQTAVWRFSYGEEPASVSVSAVLTQGAPRLWLNIARASAAGFAGVLLLVILAFIVSVIRKPKGRGRRATRRRKQRAAMREAEASAPRKRLLRLLVVDVHGVVVRPTDPFEGLLMPIIRSELPDTDPELVRDRYRKLVLGRLTPEEFWSDIGLGPIAAGIETRYLSSFRLVPGLHQFLDRVAARKLPVAAVGNQPRQWGERLQRMAQIEDSIKLWLTSGEVGAVLPGPPLLEAARRKMVVDANDCLYLSSVPQYLDEARELGMATAYFTASPNDMQETEHTLVRGFDDILRGRGAS